MTRLPAPRRERVHEGPLPPQAVVRRVEPPTHLRLEGAHGLQPDVRVDSTVPREGHERFGCLPGIQLGNRPDGGDQHFAAGEAAQQIATTWARTLGGLRDAQLR